MSGYGKDKCFNIIYNSFLAGDYIVRQLKRLRQLWNIPFCKTKFSNTLDFIKCFPVQLVMLLVRVNLPRLAVILKENKV